MPSSSCEVMRYTGGRLKQDTVRRLCEPSSVARFRYVDRALYRVAPNTKLLPKCKELVVDRINALKEIRYIFVKLECRKSTVILSLNIAYSMRDKICGVS